MPEYTSICGQRPRGPNNILIDSEVSEYVLYLFNQNYFGAMRISSYSSIEVTEYLYELLYLSTRCPHTLLFVLITIFF